MQLGGNILPQGQAATGIIEIPEIEFSRDASSTSRKLPLIAITDGNRHILTWVHNAQRKTATTSY